MHASHFIWNEMLEKRYMYHIWFEMTC